jgi:hypothetical protein
LVGLAVEVCRKKPQQGEENDAWGFHGESGEWDLSFEPKGRLTAELNLTWDLFKKRRGYFFKIKT